MDNSSPFSSDIKTYITIAQFNIQSVNNKKPLLFNFISANDIDICLLNETFLKETSNFSVPGYDIIKQNGPNGHGGVAILIKNTFKYKVVQTPYYDFMQTAAITIKTDIGILSLLCVYSPPRGGRFKTRKLKQIIDDLPKPIMLSGDLNAHHVAFGCMSTNSRGNDIYNLLDECDLCILNTGSPTTVGTAHHNPSAIDISCISPTVAPLCEWKVHDDPMGSYHFPTIVNIQTSVQKYIIGPPSERFIYSRANWSKFHSESEQAFNNLNLNTENILNIYNSFCDILNNLKLECIPKIVHKSSYTLKKPVPWWDNECWTAVNNSKSALRHYRLYPTIENYIEYKKVDAKKKKLISEKKKLGWNKLCESFNRYTPVSMIWNYIRRFKRAACRKAPKNDEWIPSFFDKYAPISPPEKNIDREKLNYFFQLSGNSNSCFLSEPFTMNEFKIALKSRKDTTPGLDDITYKLICNLHSKAQSILLKIFNLLWLSEIIPESWKTQCVIPILKPDKSENNSDSYRPISLSSCVGKLFECMLKFRLEYYSEKNNILPKQQFGFRRGRSATESFISLISDIKKSFHNFSYTTCAFLDVRGAFDNVNPSVLIEILSDVGVPGRVCKWIFSFLYERTMYVKFNNILHGPRLVYKGTMQGSTISPLLFNLYTSQINKYLTNTSVKCLLFADDIVVYTINRNINMAIQSLNNGLNQIHRFYNYLKLDINVSKSGAMIFSKKTINSEETTPILYNNNPLVWLSVKKFLGICLDTQLKFETHINYIIKNASKGLNILRSLAGVHWGSDPKVLSMLYKSIVRSHFDYSCLAYMNINVAHLRKLDIIQNKALRIISGAMCSTPINAMESETGIIPLKLRRLQIANNFSVKLLAVNNTFVLNRILPSQDLPQTLLNNINISAEQFVFEHTPELLTIILNLKSLCKNMYICNNLPIYDSDFKCISYDLITINTEKVNNQFEFLEFVNSQPNAYILYTDGSKDTDIVTSAYYDPQVKQTKCFKLDTQCSVFTAECYAIYRALLYVHCVNRSEFLVVSDSKSCLLALNSTYINYKLNYILFDIKKVILELKTTGKIVRFKWVPSHCGISGNEVVDKATRGNYDANHTTLLKIPFTDYHERLRKDLYSLWHNYWKLVSQDKGKWYTKIQVTPPPSPWYHKNKDANCRNFITTINRLRFGHCRTPAHLARLKIISESEGKCNSCSGEVADLEHIIMKCQKYNMQRLILVSDLQSVCESDNVPTHIEELLSNSVFFKFLYKFIVSTVGNI